MKEDFVQYLWKFQKFSVENLRTTDGDTLQVLKSGTHNIESDGPDFFVAQLMIGNQKWAGNVEIHVKSSDWYLHNHQTDTKYDSIILHVVWEDDVEVYRKNNTKIPTLELKKFILDSTLIKYRNLYSKKEVRWINCENQLSGVDNFIWNNWLERIYLERLEEKTQPVLQLLATNKNNWEETCFCLIAKAFGGNTNGDAFFAMAQSIPFKIVQKENSVFKLEALFMGQCNMLNDQTDNQYEKKLCDEYDYLKNKFGLTNLKTVSAQFYRLRPQNFPTIRLAQLADLFAKTSNLFQSIIEVKTYKNICRLLVSSTSEYWKSHYNFGKISNEKTKKTTISFLKVIVLNSIFPLRFLYQKSISNDASVANEIISMLSNLSPEKNSIVDGYKLIGVKVFSSLQSQALLTLKKEYCSVNKCLQCPIGVLLLKP